MYLEKYCCTQFSHLRTLTRDVSVDFVTAATFPPYEALKLQIGLLFKWSGKKVNLYHWTAINSSPFPLVLSSFWQNTSN